MGHDLVCFRDGSKASKSFVALCVSQIKMMVMSQDGWPVIMHLIEMSQSNQPTSAAQFGSMYLKRLVAVGVLVKDHKCYHINPIFRQVLLVAEAQNNIYQTVFDKVVYDKDPEPTEEELDETEDPTDSEETIPKFIIFGAEPLFKKLSFTFEFYDSQTGAYSNIDYKPDTEFAIPETVIGFLKSIE
jgi:hypothetical protein